MEAGTHFSYKCQRSRNDAGFPYGETTPTELLFTIRLGAPDDGKVFYQQMQRNELFDHTFIFNASFDQTDRLKTYDDAMIVRGYVVDVKEDYDATITENGTVQVPDVPQFIKKLTEDAIYIKPIEGMFE